MSRDLLRHTPAQHVAFAALAVIASSGAMLLSASDPALAAEGHPAIGALAAPPEVAPSVESVVERTEEAAMSELVESAEITHAQPPLGTPIPGESLVVPVEPPPPANPSITPSGWYTPVRRYAFSARFGVPGSWSSGYHTGLDFQAGYGAPLRAATDGTVVEAGDAGAYGLLIRIKIAPRTEIWMAHNATLRVKAGDKVKAGDIVGTIGLTGRTTGPHSHFEVRVNDKPKDPEDFFWPNTRSVKRLR